MLWFGDLVVLLLVLWFGDLVVLLLLLLLLLLLVWLLQWWQSRFLRGADLASNSFQFVDAAPGVFQTVPGSLEDLLTWVGTPLVGMACRTKHEMGPLVIGKRRI